MSQYQIKEIKSPKEINEWDVFAQNNGGSYFQSLHYYSFCKSTHGYEPHILICSSGNEIVGGVLLTLISSGKGLKKLLSRRIIITGGPVVDRSLSESNIITEQLLSFLVSGFTSRALYIEFRNLNDMEPSKRIFDSFGFSYNAHLNYRVHLESFDSVKQGMSKSKWRQINKSLKAGASIELAESESDLKEFYLILYDLYKEKIRKPLPGYQFFLNYFQFTKDSGNFRVFIVRYKEKVIGGMIAPVFNDTIYEWYICGHKQSIKNVYPSVLATWAAINYGLEHQLKYFDFLGAGKPNEDYGVREFKARFGGELLNYGRFTRINNQFLYWLGKFGLTVLQKIHMA